MFERFSFINPCHADLIVLSLLKIVTEGMFFYDQYETKNSGCGSKKLLPALS